MESIWMAIAPGPMRTRVLAMRGPHEMILKGQLQRSPQSSRALQSLLEAVALWEGLPVRAALVVGAGRGTSESSLYRDAFPDHGQTPLYSLDWVHTPGRRRRRDDLGGLGSFADLEGVLRTEVAR